MVAALVVAEAAVLLLRPRDGVIEPAPVNPASYFTAEQIQRAEDFRGPQRIIGLVILGVEGAVLVWLVARPPRALRRGFARPVLAAAGAGAVLSVALQIVPLPLRAIARQRAVDVGLSTQGWPEWAGDLVKAWAIGGVFAGAGGRRGRGAHAPLPARLVAARRRARRRLRRGHDVRGADRPGPDLQPVHPLPEGRTRADVLALAREAGVDVGEVYEVDASRRTTGANAYVAGLGRTKRVVLYDNLLENFTRDEIRLVVAHELAHVHYRDVPNGLLFLALVAPAGMFAAARLTGRLAPQEQDRPGPAVLPAVALSVLVLSTAITSVPTSSRGAWRRAPTPMRCSSRRRPIRSSTSRSGSPCAT